MTAKTRGGRGLIPGSMKATRTPAIYDGPSMLGTVFSNRASPINDPEDRFTAGRFGMQLFLVSLGVLFAATLVAFAVIRLQAKTWPEDLPRAPAAVWISTLVLLASSVTMQRALIRIRCGNADGAGWAMLITTLLGAAFLGLQATAWTHWLVALANFSDDRADNRFALTGFFVLTGLHAAHVIGGLVPMVIVTRRAMHGRYSASTHDGIHYCAMYWHFLDAVWVVLFLTLLLCT